VSNAKLDLLQVTLDLMVPQTLNVMGPLDGNQDPTQWEPVTMMIRVLAASGEGGWLWAS
jgi:hypothetical protein